MPWKTIREKNRTLVVILKVLIVLKIIERNNVPTGVSIFFHEAPTKNRQKILNMIVEKKQCSKFKIAIIELKNMGKCCDSNPYLTLLNPVVLTTVLQENLENLTKVSEIIKLYGTPDIRVWTYYLRNFCPNLTAEIYNRKSLQKYTEKKKNDSTE